MRIVACCRGAPRVMLALGPLAMLCCVVSCGVTSRGVEVEDSIVTADSPYNAAESAYGAAGPVHSAMEPEITTSVEPLTDEWIRLRGTTLETLGSLHRLVFDLSRPPESVEHFQLSTPPRVVIDVRGPHRAAGPVDSYDADDLLVKRVRVGHYDGRMRLVIDMREELPAAYSVRREGGALVVYIGDLGGGAGTGESRVNSSTHNPTSEGDTWWSAAADEVAEAEDSQDQSGTPVSAMSSSDEVEAAEEPVPTELPAVPSSDPEPSHEVAHEEKGTPRLAKLTQVPRNAQRPRRYTGKRISLDFKDADVQNVLRVLADVSRLNIVATDEVTGRVTLHLVDVPWDQALDVVLEANRLKMIRQGNVIRVSTVDRVREEQEALRAQQAAAQEVEPLQVRYVRVNYARADEALLDKVKGVLTERGSASFDERTNTVILRDINRGIHDAVELISHLDIQSPQVLIEANLVEASTDFARALGIQWGYRHLMGPRTGNPTGADFPGTVDIGGSGLGTGTPAAPAGAGAPQPSVPFLADFPVPSNFGPGFGADGGSALNLALGSLSGASTLSSRLTALEEMGKGKIISRPRVVTLNNIPATIQSLTILRVKLPSTGTVLNTGTGGVAGSASAATEKIETGIILVVTPQVSSDGYVLLGIRAKSSQADFTRTVDEIPVEVSREATSNVLIRDGETVVLGGIFRNEASDTDTGVPYLRRVPALGWLFKRMLKRDRREELLVFITPQVVAGYGEELPSAAQLWESRLGS